MNAEADKIHVLALTMSDSVILIENFKMIYGELGLRSADLVGIERRWMLEGFVAYSLWHDILNSLASRNPGQDVVNLVVQAVNSLKWAGIATNIERAFSERCKADPGTTNRELSISIRTGDTAKSYANVFGEFLRGGVTQVWIEEPLVHTRQQFRDFKEFVSLICAKCSRVEKITLLTQEARNSSDIGDQRRLFGQLKAELWPERKSVNLPKPRQIEFVVEMAFAHQAKKLEIHDDEQCLQINLGAKGLHYFEAVCGSVTIGALRAGGRPDAKWDDQNLRECLDSRITYSYKPLYLCPRN